MRATDAAYAQLRDEILSWRILPGTPLSEVDLAARLGVSRTPLRAALARLALEGLVDTTRGRTALVSDMSPAGLAELFELREALEMQAARLAARRRDPQVFDGLAAEFSVAATTLADHGVEAYYDVIARFDQAVDDAVGNSALTHALDTVRTHLIRARRIAADDERRLERAAEEHRVICEAIRDGDPELAIAATTVHLRGSLTTILAKLDTQSDRTARQGDQQGDQQRDQERDQERETTR
jgi:DNA-binding GntR family transcriptional regulator